ncbi:DNA gyrase modulator, partial [Actinoplanes sp. NPDC048791]|uniref:PmbA/TldA family metallopeptidase n=1 Tax=Actinoplanes sp. NPDC048791 TaxID=3154623 RepID=UPI0033F59726
MSAELDLAARVVELTRRLAGPGAEAEVVAAHSAEALTRFANSAIHQNVADATTTVRLRVHLDGRTAGGSTTVTDADGLQSLVERTIAASRLSPPDQAWPGLTPPTPLRDSPAFDEATAAAGPHERAARVRDFVRAAGGLETAGFCRTTYSSGGFANTAGQAVEGRAA